MESGMPLEISQLINKNWCSKSIRLLHRYVIYTDTQVWSLFLLSMHTLFFFLTTEILGRLESKDVAEPHPSITHISTSLEH